MATSRTLIVAAALSCLLVCGRADRCAPDCRIGLDAVQLFPHPQDCNRYYQCSAGTAVLRNCPAGLEFSPTGLHCGYPAQTGCTSDPARECAVAATSPEPELTTAAASTPKCAPKCPWAYAYMPHPQDCSKFYICGDMEPIEWSCQTGLLFDMRIKQCEYSERAICYSSPTLACDVYLG